MRKNMDKKRSYINSRPATWIVLLIISVIFFSILYYKPYQGDDFWFQFKKVGIDGVFTLTCDRILGIGDLWETILAQRYITNGRLGDICTLVLINLFDKEEYAGFQSMIMVCFVVLTAKCCFRRINACSALCVCCGSLLLLPNIHATMFWVPGACNYLWGALLATFFFCTFDRGMVQGRKLHLILCLLSACLCAAWHEALGLGILGAVVMRMVALRYLEQRSMRLMDVAVVLMLLIGLCVPLSAAGMWQRVESGSSKGSSSLAAAVYTMVAIVPSLALVGIAIWKQKKAFFRNLLSYFIVSELGLVLLITLFAGASGAFAGLRFFFAFGVLLLVLSAFSGVLQKHSGKISLLCFTVLLCWWVPSLRLNREATHLVRQAVTSPVENGIVVLDTTKNPHVTESWRVLWALPYHPTERRHAALLLRKEPFHVVYNALVDDASVVKVFDGCRDDMTHVWRDKDKCFIRLPKGVVPYYRQSYTLDNNEGKYIGLVNPYVAEGPLPRYITDVYDRYVRKAVQLIRFSPYYADGFHYLVLTPCTDEQLVLKANVFAADSPDNKYIMEIPLKNTILPNEK